MADASNDTTDT